MDPAFVKEVEEFFEAEAVFKDQQQQDETKEDPVISCVDSRMRQIIADLNTKRSTLLKLVDDDMTMVDMTSAGYSFLNDSCTKQMMATHFLEVHFREQELIKLLTSANDTSASTSQQASLFSMNGTLRSSFSSSVRLLDADKLNKLIDLERKGVLQRFNIKIQRKIDRLMKVYNSANHHTTSSCD